MSQSKEKSTAVLSQIPAARKERRQRWRTALDKTISQWVSLGGISVIVAIVLIFFYLLYVVFPLLVPADAKPVADYMAPGAGQTLYLAMEEQAEVGVRVTDAGQVVFFRLADATPLDSIDLPIPSGVSITSVGHAMPDTRVMALGLSDGGALIIRPDYQVTFPNDQRLITPVLSFPLGEKELTVAKGGLALKALAIQSNEEQTTLAAVTPDNALHLLSVTREESFLGDDVELVETRGSVTGIVPEADFVLINPEQWSLYVANSHGKLQSYDIHDKAAPQLLETVQLTEDGQQLTSLDLLAGGISLMAGSDDGSISQWFKVRDQSNQQRLQRIRAFADQHAPISAFTSEFARKGFLAADSAGNVAIYHATAHNLVYETRLVKQPVRQLAVSPRADAWLAEDAQGRLHFWHIHNEHPEISWSSLWGKVWYESYPKPDFIWQSSSASNDFEPKFSLTPLAFGTLKAAFYAMLLAMPLAILGAIYTAYFMTPRMRVVVKPTIEVMEALPTVILGFLAGLWLAPFVENYLPGIFSLFVIMPLGILLAAYLWHRLPETWRNRLSPGWEAALLIPVVILISWFAFKVSHPLEVWLFGGDIQHWMRSELGISFDQRNSIVVGLAMGFAVIPTIFSIAEDAIFNVPRHLTSGSLALGATPWQTLVRVVILTASPGIFSAVMIGLGRAVGETMIVLMATGNTPVMDLSIFQGMRTLSANIAVEMPESEVDSTHYRVLFLAALVLFLFTFIFNTLAELVRQRLRSKYASL